MYDCTAYGTIAVEPGGRTLRAKEATGNPANSLQLATCAAGRSCEVISTVSLHKEEADKKYRD